MQSIEGMIYASSSMKKILEISKKLAKTPVPILIIGESGTGRKSLACAIHEFSPNKERQFFSFTYLGHGEKDHSENMKPRIAGFIKANIGTLYIEEIASLPLLDQLALDNYLKIQESKPSSPNTRVIAATRKDLAGLIKEDKFRSDLYFKFFALNLPPLREREDDILPLAEFFINKYSKNFKKEISGLDSKSELLIKRHSWPGNILELENSIRKAVLLAEKSKIVPEDLGLSDQEDNEGYFELTKAREKFEKEILERALRRNAGNLTKTANQLGISRPTLYEMIEKYRIRI